VKTYQKDTRKIGRLQGKICAISTIYQTQKLYRLMLFSKVFFVQRFHCQNLCVKEWLCVMPVAIQLMPTL